MKVSFTSASFIKPTFNDVALMRYYEYHLIIFSFLSFHDAFRLLVLHVTRSPCSRLRTVASVTHLPLAVTRWHASQEKERCDRRVKIPKIKQVSIGELRSLRCCGKPNEHLRLHSKLLGCQ